MHSNTKITIKNLYQDLAQTIEHLSSDHTHLIQQRKKLEDLIGSEKRYYGINTGLGGLAEQTIGLDDQARQQSNILRSHAVALGEWIPYSISQLMLQLKVHALSLGYSAISIEPFQRLLWFAQTNTIPAVKNKGSLGASGDLAPLASMCLPLIGEGQFWDEEGQHVLSYQQRLADSDQSPVNLKAKDALALCNGTQMMTAYGAYVLHQAQTMIKSADIIAAMSLEALKGSAKPFDKRFFQVRPHPGHGEVADNIIQLLKDSEIMLSHQNCTKVQDPYSLRCIPQVHGASRDALKYAIATLEIELNSATDNPLLFDEDVLSGGNFHGQPLAYACDIAAIALAELASIAERRIYLLLAGRDGLPKLLMEQSGIYSGLMITQYTAAALVSENKVLCHPASVDSIPSSLGQEDHVSMGSISATKLLTVMQNCQQVMAIELLCASQALDYRRPMKPGAGILAAYDSTRENIEFREQDGLFVQDIETLVEHIQNNKLNEDVESVVGVLV